MTTLQKIIKYLALALAVFIIMNIVAGIMFTLGLFRNVLGLTKKDDTKVNEEKESSIITNFENSEQLNNLKVKLAIADLDIKKGDTLKIVNNDEDIKCNKQGNEIIIEDEDEWKINTDEKKVILYVPENMIFDEVNIESGAGKLDIETLKANKLKLQIGAGKTDIQNIEVTDNAKIEGGVGTVKISSGKINDLRLNMGIGKFEMTATITGDNKIDAGVGKLDIDLMDDEKNYTIEASKGIGSISIFGNNISENERYGNGKNYIKVSGGIGSIQVR